MITNTTPKFLNFFFLDLAISVRSGQYLAGTGPERDMEKNDRIDRNRISGRTLGQTNTDHDMELVVDSCSIQIIFHRSVKDPN